jgi:carbon-monoxide dehydrogenase large subunit
MTRIAAHMMEAAPADIAFEAEGVGMGRFTIRGTDKAQGWDAVVRRAFQASALPPEIEPGLAEQAQYAQEGYTFPNGCHIAEVEIDPQTGHSRLASYSALDDSGNILDHTIVAGQVHGSVAMGFGQAMLEQTVFDRGSGQLVTASFMDYAMPRAEDLPMFKDEVHVVPATTNPLGTKGAGEAGTTAAISAIMNAFADAIPGGAGARIDMPATPEKVWRACQQAGAN